MFPTGVRVADVNMINNDTTISSQTHQRPFRPSPFSVTLFRVFWFKFHCDIRLHCGLGFTSYFLFLALTCFRPELEITLSTPSCDIRSFSSSRWQCSETNKKSPSEVKIYLPNPSLQTTRQRYGGATSKPSGWCNTKRKSLTNIMIR